VNCQSGIIALEKMMASISGTNMENKRLAGFGQKWARALVVLAAVSALPGVAAARDPGINQPGAAGNVHRDPGINQPGAAGNVGAPGVGRDPGINQPGEAGNVHRDPGINQPGAAGNVGAPGVGRDPGINQPGEAGNRRRVR
jgi:hypothetical protein